MSTAPTHSIPKPTIRRGYTHSSIYHVSSRSKPGTFHTVDVLHLTCTCAAGRRRLRCWHLAWAIQFETWRARQVAAASLAASAAAAAAAAVAAPPPVPFQETAGFKALAACFG